MAFYSLSWLKPGSGLSPCSGNATASRARFVSFSERVSKMGEGELASASGCVPACERAEYGATSMWSSVIDIPGWPKNATALQFYYTGSGYVERQEYLVYNYSSLFADFGSYLGMLMGAWLLSLYEWARALYAKGGGCLGMYRNRAEEKS